jgi:phospholipid/cholesterol/gamma-HCH transport system substrate-binding protein
MTRELRIGIFVGTAIFILAVFIFIVGDMSVLFKSSGYTVSADFETAVGLDKRAAVKMAGVPIGYVKDIKLVRRRAQVFLTIYPQVEIPKDSQVTFSSIGLLGEKHVEIIPGRSTLNCQEGDVLTGLPSAGIDQVGTLLLSLGDQVKDAGGAIKEMLGPETKANLNQALENLAAASFELKDFLGRNQGDIKDAVSGARQTFQNLDKKVEGVAVELQETLRLLKDMAAENRDNLKLNLEKIKELIGKMEESLKLLNSSLEKINRGEGTLGKIIQDPELYTKAKQTLDDVRKAARPISSLRGRLDLRADYYGRSDLVKAGVMAGLWLTPNFFAEAGVVRNPWEKAFMFSLAVGYRWGDLVPRAGFIESEFGVGLDYYAFNDRWSISLEGFDFNRPDSPHYRVFSRFSPLKYLYLVAGLDDFSLASRRGFFFGLGLELR